MDGINVQIPFQQPGLGISRSVLDDIFARGTRVRQGYTVREVKRSNSGFIVDGIACSVVVDASGKLGRFSRRRRVDEFGVQYTDPQSRGSTLDFWFFADRY